MSAAVRTPFVAANFLMFSLEAIADLDAISIQHNVDHGRVQMPERLKATALAERVTILSCDERVHLSLSNSGMIIDVRAELEQRVDCIGGVDHVAIHK